MDKDFDFVRMDRIDSNLKDIPVRPPTKLVSKIQSTQSLCVLDDLDFKRRLKKKKVSYQENLSD
jgi:hypothetical protein